MEENLFLTLSQIGQVNIGAVQLCLSIFEEYFKMVVSYH